MNGSKLNLSVRLGGRASIAIRSITQSIWAYMRIGDAPFELAAATEHPVHTGRCQETAMRRRFGADNGRKQKVPIRAAAPVTAVVRGDRILRTG
jgi:hypothetical protein